jgi:hypothetical protein
MELAEVADKLRFEVYEYCQANGIDESLVVAYTQENEVLIEISPEVSKEHREEIQAIGLKYDAKGTVESEH